MVVPFLNCDITCAMFKRKRSVNKRLLERKLHLARQDPEPIFDISGCDLIDVPSGIYSLCKVFLKTTLNLRANQLTSLSGGGELRDLINLRILDLGLNQLQSIPEEICLLINLRELHLDNNQLKSLPNSLCDLSNLRLLNLQNNNLRKLPENIGSLGELRKLLLLGNKRLEQLPKSTCRANRLRSIELDCENYVYPPKEVAFAGTESIMRYISKDVGVEYVEPEEFEEDFEDKPHSFQLNESRELPKMEINQESVQKQESELVIANEANRKKFLASITRQQTKIDLEIDRIYKKKETERFRLIEQLQEAENNADIAIENLLTLNKEAMLQVPDIIKEIEEDKNEEKEEKARLLLRRKNDILEDMKMILQQETETFQNIYAKKMQASKDVLEQEFQTNSELKNLLETRNLQQSALRTDLLEETELQKVAVEALLERGDSKSWTLLQQVKMVQSQLGILTRIELERRKLEMDQCLNDFSEKRANLSVLLQNLLEQQDQRRAELFKTLQAARDAQKANEEDFWLLQYQKLLDKLPEGLSRGQRNIDPRLAEILSANAALHCLPFLAKLTQNQSNPEAITEENLLDVGLTSSTDRQKVLDSLQIYTKSILVYDRTPSAPPLLDEASAPSVPTDVKAIKEVECVICMEIECQVIFVPCGHLCCCPTCSGHVSECPLCRTGIERKIVV